MAGEGHFQHGGNQAAVGTVVVGQQVTVGVQALDHGEEGLEVFGIVDVRCLGSDLAVGLGQDRGAHAVLATAQVDQDQVGFTLVHAQLRGQGLADVGDRGEAGDDQRHWRGDALLDALVAPLGLHRHRVFADRNGDAQLRAQLHADSLDGVVQAGVFTRVAGGGHPVGRQFDVGQLVDACSGQVGQCLANGHAAGRRGIQQRQRGTLAHGHGFTGVDVEAGGGDGAVGHRYLPRADHLVTGNQAGDGAVADGDQEALAGHGRVAEDALNGVVQVQLARVEVIAQLGFAGNRTVHAWWLAQQHIERHVYRRVAEVAVAYGQVLLFSRFTHYGKRATLTFADGLEALEVDGADGQHVTFLRFVAPDFVRGHARLVVGHVAQLEAATTATVVDQLREGVGDTAGADVVDEGDRVLVAQLPAAVDDLLATALHFRVFALYRSKVQVSRAGTSRHRRSGAAAQADQHGRATEHDQLGADSDLTLLHVVFTDVAHATGQHDRLVVAAHFFTVRGVDGLLEGTEVTGQGRATEFVVERSATQRAFDHDVEGVDDALRLAVGLLPRLFEARDTQVGHGEAGQAGLGLGTTAGRAFVADFAAGAGGGAGERGDGGRVVVGFHLHQDVHRLLHRAVLAGFRVREETAGNVADDHRGVVLVRRQHTFVVHLVGVLDHAEQALFLSLAVDVPTGVEDLVAAVLGVGLGEHHQFDVVRVALETLEGVDQVVDLVFGQGQAQVDVGLGQGVTATGEDVHRGHRLGLGMAEQVSGLLQLAEHALGHAVVQLGGDQFGVGFAQAAGNVVGDTALQALDRLQAAVVGNVAGLAGPGRNGAQARHDQEQAAARLLYRHARAVLEQTAQHLLLVGGQLAVDIGEVGEFGIQTSNSGNFLAQLLE